MQVAELAALMGQKESDVQAFVDCLRIWINKGYSFEEAIERHMAQMNRMAERATEFPRSIVVETFFPA